MYDFDHQKVSCDCFACSYLISDERIYSPFLELNFMLLRAALSYLDSDCDYPTWSLAGAVTFTESGGNEEGHALFDSWSYSGSKYRTSVEVDRLWLSFNDDPPWSTEINKLRYLLEGEGVDWEEVHERAEDEYFLMKVMSEAFSS